VTLVMVFTGGDDVAVDIVDDIPADVAIVAADSGLSHAEACGRTVDVAVGDFDSVEPATLQRAEQLGTVIERHPAAKDRTDLALALDRALAMGADEVLVVGGHGGRLDHLLGNVLLLAAPEYAGVRMRWRGGAARATIVQTEAEITGTRGELVSLLPLHGPALGVTAEGLLFPLSDATLAPGTSRGVSNELVAERARIGLTGGVLLVVQPGEQGDLLDGLSPQ